MNPWCALGTDMYITGNSESERVLVVIQEAHLRAAMENFPATEPAASVNEDHFKQARLAADEAGDPPLNAADRRKFRSQQGSVAYLATHARHDVAARAANLAEGQAAPRKRRLEVVGE